MPDSATDSAFTVDFFTGDANPAVARVYVRLKLNAPDELRASQWKITGRLLGPTCEFAQTLSARIPFVELRAVGESNAEVIAEAVVPDPCFWTPELPNLCRAQLEIARDGSPVEKIDRLCGIRRWGVRGRWLLFEGKRFVLRGVGFGRRKAEERRKAEGGRRNGEVQSAECRMQNGAQIRDSEFGIRKVEELQIAECRVQSADWVGESDEQFARGSWTGVVCEDPSDEVCAWASRRGVMLIADLRTLSSGRGQGEGEAPPPYLPFTTTIESALRRLAQWPAVMIAILPSDAVVDESMRRAIPNLLLAQFISADRPLALAPWAQVALVEPNDPSDFARRVENCPVPVLVVRQGDQFTSIETGRAACDLLQRDLAPLGDFAGYLV